MPNTVPVPTALEVVDMNNFLSIALIPVVTPVVAAAAAAISVCHSHLYIRNGSLGCLVVSEQAC